MTRTAHLLATLTLATTCVGVSTAQAQFRSMPMTGSYGHSVGGLGPSLGAAQTIPLGGPTIEIGKLSLESTLPSVPTVHPQTQSDGGQTATPAHDWRAVPPSPPAGGCYVAPVVPDDDSDDEDRDSISNQPTPEPAPEQLEEDTGWSWNWGAVLAIVVFGWFVIRRD